MAGPGRPRRKETVKRLHRRSVLEYRVERFSEIPPYLRAYGWFLKTLPDVARRRRAIQRRRKVSDRRVRRYMVRDLPRARIFLERRLMQWGEETVRLSAKTFANLTPGALADRLGRWARSASVLTSLAIAFVLMNRFGDRLGIAGYAFNNYANSLNFNLTTVSYCWMLTNGFMADGTHLNYQGSKYLAGFVWDDLGFFALRSPRRLAIQSLSAQFKLSYATAPNILYTLESSEDLIQWQPLVSTVGDGAMMSTNLSASSLRRSFRLRLTPNP